MLAQLFVGFSSFRNPCFVLDPLALDYEKYVSLALSYQKYVSFLLTSSRHSSMLKEDDVWESKLVWGLIPHHVSSGC